MADTNLNLVRRAVAAMCGAFNSVHISDSITRKTGIKPAMGSVQHILVKMVDDGEIERVYQGNYKTCSIYKRVGEDDPTDDELPALMMKGLNGFQKMAQPAEQRAKLNPRPAGKWRKLRNREREISRAEGRIKRDRDVMAINPMRAK